MTPDDIQLAKVGIEQAMKPYVNLIEKLLGPAAETLGDGLGARLGPWRLKRQIRAWQQTQEMIREAGFEPKPVPPKILLPIIQNASLEGDDNLQDRWVALLTNSANPNAGFDVPPAFPDMLNQLSPTEVQLLDRLFSIAYEKAVDPKSSLISINVVTSLADKMTKTLLGDKNDLEKENSGANVEIAVDNLLRLRILEGHSSTVPSFFFDSYYFTGLEVTFVAACQPPNPSRSPLDSLWPI